MLTKLDKAIPLLNNIFDKTKPDIGHDLNHAIIVHRHGINAIESCGDKLSDEIRLSIELACLTHDLDDEKVVGKQEVELKYAKDFLDHYPDLNSGIKTLIISMIKLVSCSKNGDVLDNSNPTWMYIPRYCDRLEAIGDVGVERCLSFSKDRNRPLYNENTKIPKTLEELDNIATKNRYTEYCTGKRKSETTLDHFYDKILHVGVPNWMCNTYLENEARKRQIYVKGWIMGVSYNIKI